MVTFWILAPIMVLAALAILFTRRAVHCALLLAVVMVSLAMLYVAQDAPFLFAVQIIVYTGAILILFLFVLMLVGVDASDSLVETIRGQRVLATLVGLGFAAVLVLGISQVGIGPVAGLTGANADGNVQGIARILFTKYVFAFELTSALLITAALGAMVLAHRERLTPKLTQADLAAQRMRDYAAHGLHLGPLPPPGTFARHNAVDTPALLPDGSAAPGSVSRVLVARGQVLAAPHDVEVIRGEIDEHEQPHQVHVDAAAADPARASEPAATSRITAVDPSAGAVPDEYAGSARPFTDGTQPAGFVIKGNKGSGLYHEPGGRWYAVTIAEVWFDTVASAEAAGFTKAGSRPKRGPA